MQKCSTFELVKFILMSYSRVHTYFSMLFFPKAPQIWTQSQMCVGGRIHPFCLHVALEPQAAKMQTFMSANNAMPKCGAVSGFLLVFSDIISLFQTLFYTRT